MDAVPQLREDEDDKTPAAPLRFFPWCLPCLGSGQITIRSEPRRTRVTRVCPICRGGGLFMRSVR